MAINNKAMLVRLTISQWTNRALDSDGSQAVADKFQINKNEGNYVKSLIDPLAMKPIINTISTIRKFHYEQTLPWADEGVRILASTNYFPYLQGMSEYKNKFESAVTQFIQNYPTLVSEAQQRKNGLFKGKDYPQDNKINSYFNITTTFMPFPTSSDFRVDIPEKELQEIKSKTDETLDNIAKQSVAECLTRLHTTVAHMANRLTIYNAKTAPFRDSLVDNIILLTSLIPRMNITSDVPLNHLCEEAEKLCTNSAEILREDLRIRNTTAAKADGLAIQIRKHNLWRDA